MRQIHRAGEKTFIDFSGKRPSLVDRRTGELRPVELFVSVLGASSLTYAEATETQQLPDWVNAHIRMAEYFGGSTTMWVPDQLKSAITRPLPLRARRQPHLRRPGRPLRRGRHPGAAEETSRQGCGRELCAHCTAVDTRPSARPDLLRARSAQRRDPRPARRAQRPADEEAGRQPPRPLRAARPPGAAAPAGRAFTSSRSGSDAASTSTITWRSSTTSTACRTNWSASRSRSATRPTRSRSSTATSASRRTGAATTDSRRPLPSTCPAPTARMPSGRRRA